jgi:hypothetical protein
MWRLGIRYVVTVPDIWTEAEVIRNFYAVVAGEDFDRVAAVAVEGHAKEKELLLYRFTGDVKEPPDHLVYETSAAGVVVGGNGE